MDKTEAIATLMEVSETDLSKLSLEQLRDVLGAIRFVTRIVEREVVKREMEAGIFQ